LKSFKKREPSVTSPKCHGSTTCRNCYLMVMSGSNSEQVRLISQKKSPKKRPKKYGFTFQNSRCSKTEKPRFFGDVFEQALRRRLGSRFKSVICTSVWTASKAQLRDERRDRTLATSLHGLCRFIYISN
jgi:hypothetical protein